MLIVSCEKPDKKEEAKAEGHPGPSEVVPLAIAADSAGFGFFAKMQGHWVGSNTVSSIRYPWFAFDYRAISASHVFGIFEGGSLGNLLTSFFVANYKGTKTIMARNGGVLGDLYRASYFVLDEVTTAEGAECFRFVDAVGGKNVMWIDVCFKDATIDFKAYRSGLGRYFPPELHMDFKAVKKHGELATTAATATSYPSENLEKNLSGGFNEANLYRTPGKDKPVSATFLYQGDGSLATRATQAGDPFPPADHSRLASLNVAVTRGSATGKLFMFLSKDPLTDSGGQVGGDAALDTVLQFPTLSATASSYLFSYLHPGRYYVTAIADSNDDGAVSQGDATHVSVAVDVAVDGNQEMTISSLDITY